MLKPRIHPIACCALLAFVASCGEDVVAPPGTEESPCIDYANEPGWRGSVAVDWAEAAEATGNLLVCSGRYMWLTLVEVSDPTQPRVVSKLPEPVDHIRVNGDLAYATSPIGKLVIVDIANPDAPTIVGSLDVPSLYGPQYLDVANGSAFVVESPSDTETLLRCIDVSDPVNPTSAWNAAIAAGAYDIAASDSHVFVMGRTGLHIVDAATGSSLGQDLAIPNGGTDVVYANETVFVSGGWRGGVHVVDVRKPEAPTIELELTPGITPPGRVYGLAVDGEHLFVATTRRVTVFSITNPRSPEEIGVLQTEDAFAMTAHGSRLYVIRYKEIEILDLKDFTFADAIARREVDDSIRHIELDGDLVYSFGSQIEVARVRTGSISPPLAKLDVEVTGPVVMADRLAYVRSESFLRVIDFSRPVAPREIGAVDLAPSSASFFALALGADVVYAGLWSGGLVVIDVNEPRRPHVLKRVELPAQTVHVVVGAQHAYAVGYAGLAVLDISDPRSPRQVAGLDVRGSSGTLFEDHLVVLDGDSTYVIDVSEPTQPIQVAELDNRGHASRILLDLPWAYVLQWETVRVLDFIDPRQPRYEGEVNVEYGTTSIGLGRHGLLAAGHRSMSLHPRHCR
jgi:hypothetical protein